MRWRSAVAVAVVLAAIGAAAALTIRPGGGGAAPTGPTLGRAAEAWSGLVGSPRAPVASGQRVLVVLSAFSLADRVERAGGRASDRDERRWTAAAVAAQQQFLADLARRGVRITPEYRFTRTLNGFSALLDPGAIALLERTPGVKGVYPVRVAFPASVSSQLLGSKAVPARPAVGLAGLSGRGVTIALLDTGVDLHKPYLHGQVLDGFDVIGDGTDASPHAKPTDPAQLERHGTEMAGLLVGAHRAPGLGGVAPGATVLPIRVAGWQTDDRGGYTVYARADQLLAGLERAVDPNGDGDAHDAARIALIPLVEPFAAFTDSPLARAVSGAVHLDTLVVTAAGNDGPGGPAFGSVGGPAGAPDALTVGAFDARGSGQDVRVVVRAGLDVLLDRLLPLAGSVTPGHTLLLSPAAPRGSATSLSDFFQDGASLVAGRAAVVPAGDDPPAAARWAAQAGASAVLLYGREVAPGGLGLDEQVPVPVLAIPDRTALQLLERQRTALVAVAAPRSEPAGTGIALFSSWGLAFGGGIKPELLAPGVGLLTAEPGATSTGQSLFATVNGSSAAAAVAAGAAALLAEARPEADAETLRALMVGTAGRVPGAPLAAQGSGVVDVGRAAAAEIVADPPVLSFGRGSGDGWRGDVDLRVRNVSTRRVTVFVGVNQKRNPRVQLLLSSSRVEIEPGAWAVVRVRTRPITIATATSAAGALTLTPVGGVAVRVPWAVVLQPPGVLLGKLSLSRRAFKPSATQPAVVVVRAGRVVRSGGGVEVVPVLRLDVELWTAKGKRLGLLARLRDLLPGRYAFGLTGRGPNGGILPRGRYRLEVVALPTGGGRPDVRSIPFSIR